MTIGIIGACGFTLDLAARAVESGHKILVSQPRNNSTLIPVVQKMGSNAKLVSKEKAAKARIIIMFISREDIEFFLSGLPDMTGKILIHVNIPVFSMQCLRFNLRPNLSSEIIARFLTTAHSVKILSVLDPQLLLQKKIAAEEIFYVTTNQGIKKKLETFLKTLDFSAYDFEEICKGNFGALEHLN
ncbi:NAD(P)-binding domain-containing protein [Flavobacterium sp. FlaQc-48]|uniref:NAD(P)-binding domain-containing protein n=1 Tax=Flavobacterium sp. FlaQc-48 TaxID=3374181 RepID=UPI003757F702